MREEFQEIISKLLPKKKKKKKKKEKKRHTERSDKHYTLSIPNKLRKFYEAYIHKYELLGFKTVSEMCLHILQEEAIKLLEQNPELNSDLEAD